MTDMNFEYEVLKIQSVWRSYISRKEIKVLKIQSAWRSYISRKELRILKERRDNDFCLYIDPFWIRNLISDRKLYETLNYLYIPDVYLRNQNKSHQRRNFALRKSWAIPDKTAIKEIINFYHFHKINYILEIGAGLGLWAGLLTIGGINIKATDIDPFVYLDEYNPETYTNVEHISATGAVVKYQDAECLSICWPEYDKSYATDSIKLFAGKYIIYIGEEQGGCNADDEFFDILRKEWIHIKSVYMKQWWGIHDGMDFYVRK